MQFNWHQHALTSELAPSVHNHSVPTATAMAKRPCVPAEAVHLASPFNQTPAPRQSVAADPAWERIRAEQRSINSAALQARVSTLQQERLPNSASPASPAVPTNLALSLLTAAAAQPAVAQAQAAVASLPQEAKEQLANLHPWVLDTLGKAGFEIRSTKDLKGDQRMAKSAKLQGKLFVSQRARVDPTLPPPPPPAAAKPISKTELGPEEWQRMMALADDFGLMLRPNAPKGIGGAPILPSKRGRE